MSTRIQKLIAAAGIASRRAAERMILDGEVSVNGTPITHLGAHADPTVDHIKVRGKLINPLLGDTTKRYYLLNKPRGFLSAVSDPKHRPLVTDLVPGSLRRGLHPVGRLDFNTEGLIILTNDGDLTRIVTHGGKVEKIYHVKVKGAPSEEQIGRLRRGVTIEGQRTAPAQIRLLERTARGGNCWYEVTLREGKNQQIRRMFDLIGHSVVKLQRVRIGHLDGKGIASGEYRSLSAKEVAKFFQEKSLKPQAQPGLDRSSKKSQARTRSRKTS
ncbi:MAG TPA: pseudouridine synthase [Blastocatellia bacterium]|nr:pseudouridine synthase [Blastocatellia bacterium]